MTRLTGDALAEIAGKVFGERSMTLTEAGAAYEMDELTGSVRVARRLLRSTLETLPNSAFAAQPPADGEESWSAGQVIAHIANSQASISGAVRSLLDMPESADGERHDLELIPSRDEAVTILATANTGFDAFVADIPADADLARTKPHERFGELSGKGWMMLMALHESGHLRQARALAG